PQGHPPPPGGPAFVKAYDAAGKNSHFGVGRPPALASHPAEWRRLANSALKRCPKKSRLVAREITQKAEMRPGASAPEKRVCRSANGSPILNLLMNKSLHGLRVKIFADGADKAGILSLYANALIQGLTTNPTLMRKAGIQNYEAFAKDILQSVTAKPISFEVFSDEFREMRRQALKIAAWQSNVYVKIPITNTRSESALPLVRELAQEGVKLNITAILTLEQVRGVAAALNPCVPSIVSVFAGRIADTGCDPMPLM